MKIYLISLPPFGNESSEIFTIGKIYEADLIPIFYDEHTLQPIPASYIVRCDDGYLRKVNAEYFITLEEWRENQLNKLL